MPFMTPKLVKSTDGLVTCYTCPVAKRSTININVCNVGDIDCSIKIAVLQTGVTAAAVSDMNYMEFNVPVPKNGGVLERTMFSLTVGQSIAVSTNGTVAVNVYGFEEPI